MVTASGLSGVKPGSGTRVPRNIFSARVSIYLPEINLRDGHAFSLTGKEMKKLKAGVVTELLKASPASYPTTLIPVSDFSYTLRQGELFQKNAVGGRGLLTLVPVEIRFTSFELSQKQYAFARPVIIKTEVVIDANEALFLGDDGQVYGTAP